MRGRDYRDRVIEELAASEHWLARDLAGVRELLHIALGQLQGVTYQRDRLREQQRRLRAEHRRLRESTLRHKREAA